jgi:hypothetical protein
VAGKPSGASDGKVSEVDLARRVKVAEKHLENRLEQGCREIQLLPCLEPECDSKQ